MRSNLLLLKRVSLMDAMENARAGGTTALPGRRGVCKTQLLMRVRLDFYVMGPLARTVAPPNASRIGWYLGLPRGNGPLEFVTSTIFLDFLSSDLLKRKTRRGKISSDPSSIKDPRILLC